MLECAHVLPPLIVPTIIRETCAAYCRPKGSSCQLHKPKIQSRRGRAPQMVSSFPGPARQDSSEMVHVGGVGTWSSAALR
jgi:hypothetical protein